MSVKHSRSRTLPGARAFTPGILAVTGATPIELRCSFCKKSEDTVGKLISSPSDYPRAYICDECIKVCNWILEDDRFEAPQPAAPLTLEERVLDAVAEWIRADSAGKDATEELVRLRILAAELAVDWD